MDKLLLFEMIQQNVFTKKYVHDKIVIFGLEFTHYINLVTHTHRIKIFIQILQFFLSFGIFSHYQMI